ncbi:MAG: hypothetical protein E6K88_07940 [Thaumarchaeota archaeon]|nr:MAG: hypothetical protein E6K88_07940 [Nitrososphaerota archaeon]
MEQQIRIYGTADIVERQGGYMDRAHSSSSPASYIRIRPLRKWSWAVDGPVFLDGKANIKRASSGK